MFVMGLIIIWDQNSIVASSWFMFLSWVLKKWTKQKGFYFLSMTRQSINYHLILWNFCLSAYLSAWIFFLFFKYCLSLCLPVSFFCFIYFLLKHHFIYFRLKFKEKIYSSIFNISPIFRHFDYSAWRLNKYTTATHYIT